MAAAAIIFFAFYGFDAIATAAEETKNPDRDLAIGIVGSMLLCVVIYMAVAAAAIGAIAYTRFADSPEPLALILRELDQPWAAWFLAMSAVIALPTVILAFFFGQSRIFFTMARDGLLPPSLAQGVEARLAGADHDLHRARRRGHRRAVPARRDRRARQCRNAVRVHRGVRGNAGDARARAQSPAQVHHADAVGGRARRDCRLPVAVRVAAVEDPAVLRAVERRRAGESTSSTRRGCGASARVAEATSAKHRLRNIVGGSAGNFVEWFDWYIYAAFTLYFAPSFFPEGDQTAQLLSSAAVFAVGFVMRPIGAWLFGIYADRKGRKAGLTLSVSLMCAGSLMIAAAPTYASAGLLSPAILVLARMIQGLSLGGEYGSSATYLSEMAGRERRGFWSSFQYVTLIAGQLVALALLLVLQAMLGEAALESWGWRVAFLVGALLAVVVFFIRRRLSESPSFAAPRRRRPSSGAVAVPRASARSAAGDGADRRGHARLLRLHDLHAEISRQHGRVRPRRRRRGS